MLTAPFAARADQYGFRSEPYNYSDEYKRNAARSPRPFRPYLPGYVKCSGDDRRDEDKREEIR